MKCLQVLARVGDGQLCHGGEYVDAALALRNEFKDLQPRPASKGQRNPADGLIQPRFVLGIC